MVMDFTSGNIGLSFFLVMVSGARALSSPAKAFFQRCTPPHKQSINFLHFDNISHPASKSSFSSRLSADKVFACVSGEACLHWQFLHSSKSHLATSQSSRNVICWPASCCQTSIVFLGRHAASNHMVRWRWRGGRSPPLHARSLSF